MLRMILNIPFKRADSSLSSVVQATISALTKLDKDDKFKASLD